MKKITNTSRLILALASLAMLGSYFFPLWRIDLWAPQYPEGLALYIWHNKLAGDVEVINGLNHYIGMAHLKQESFPEFGILPYLIAGFVGLGLLVALIGKRYVLLGYLGLMLTAGALALVDFYRWGYEYGHNLDPNAAIKVEGMSYQPPILGYKALLNFGAYSIPDIGGWIFISAGLVVAGLAVFEIFFVKNKKPNAHYTPLIATVVLTLFTTSCTSEPEPIKYGKDECAHCKMTIMDNRFGCELVTNKGKAMKFDDLHCMVSFIKIKNLDENSFKFLVVSDFMGGGGFLNIKDSYFLKSDLFKSPMRGDVAAFKSKQDATKGKPIDARQLTWGDLKNEF
jgi:copper chaperone NosL